MLANPSIPVLSVVLIDDHPIVREGLKAVLQSLKNEMTFAISMFDSGEKALQWLARHDADILLIDYQLEGISGAETIRRLIRFKPAAKILAVSNHGDDASITAMMDAGAMGFLLKNLTPAELLLAIETVLAGSTYYSNDVIVMLTAEGSRTAEEILVSEKHLTQREMEVFRLITEDLTSREIAEKLFIGVRTVETHRHTLMNKLKVRHSGGLVRIAVEKGLFKK